MKIATYPLCSITDQPKAEKSVYPLTGYVVTRVSQALVNWSCLLFAVTGTNQRLRTCVSIESYQNDTDCVVTGVSLIVLRKLGEA